MLILPVFIPENGPADGILNPFALSLRNARQGSAKNIVRTGAAWPDILLSSPPMKNARNRLDSAAGVRLHFTGI